MSETGDEIDRREFYREFHRERLEEAEAEAERDIAALVSREQALTRALEETRQERQRATGGLMLARKLLGKSPTGETLEESLDAEIARPDPPPDG